MAGKQELRIVAEVPLERVAEVTEFFDKVRTRFDKAAARNPSYWRGDRYPNRYPMGTANLLTLALFSAKHFPEDK